MYTIYTKKLLRGVFTFTKTYNLIVITANNASVVTIENLFLLDNCLKPVSSAYNVSSKAFVPLFLGSMARNRLAPLSSNSYRSSRKMSKTCISRCIWLSPSVDNTILLIE